MALLDRFALSTLNRAAAASAPSVLSVKLAVIERLASPFPEPTPGLLSSSCTSSSSSAPPVRGETTELMRRALRVLDASDWDDLVDERWAAGTCGFAACDDDDDDDDPARRRRGTQEPREVYVPREERDGRRNARLRNVRLRGGSLVQRHLSASRADAGAESDPAGAFCSDRCRLRSEYYRSLAGRGREPDRTEMWDEVERRRAEVRESTRALRQARAPPAPTDALPTLPDDGPRCRPAASEGEDPSAVPSAATAAELATVSTLSIHEKPIRTDGPRPEAPSLLGGDAHRDLERRGGGPPRRPLLPPPSTLSPGAARGETVGPHGLPPIRFLTRPREVSTRTATSSSSSSGSGGGTRSPAAVGAHLTDDPEQEDEFADGPVLEGIDDEHVRWLELALLEREHAES